ncbi:hypothetical protein TNCV_1979091 [Trichonephila clavipes]|nr:hypothetical protein TNCV_1979091 [Trichonephila clavipes]
MGAVGPDFILMVDNAKPYRAHLLDEFLESADIRRMDWQVRSLDINPIEQGWRTTGTRHNILGTSPIKVVCNLIQNNKVQYEVLRTNASNRSQFSARFSRFKELSERFKFSYVPRCDFI